MFEEFTGGGVAPVGVVFAGVKVPGCGLVEVVECWRVESSGVCVESCVGVGVERRRVGVGVRAPIGVVAEERSVWSDGVARIVKSGV